MPRIDIVSVNHVCLVVRDKEAADGFYIGVLGLRPHHIIQSWLVLGATSTLHLIHMPNADPADGAPQQAIQHFALQVTDLHNVLVVLLRARHKPFQMDARMAEHPLTETSDPLTFGTGTIFVRDPDGNLIEFLEMGKGLFSIETPKQ